MSLAPSADTTDRQPMDRSTTPDPVGGAAHTPPTHGDAVANSAAAASAGEVQIPPSGHHLTLGFRMLTYAPVSCACWCVGASMVGGGVPRMDESGTNQLCEECSTRLSRCKGKLHKHENGKICTPCYKREQGYQLPSSSQTAITAHKSRGKRKRPKSDPGEAITLTSTRTRPHRITAPKPPTSRYTKLSAAEILAQLDATHARRMALLEAEAKIGVEFDSTD